MKRKQTLEKHKLSKPTQEEIENLNSSIYFKVFLSKLKPIDSLLFQWNLELCWGGGNWKLDSKIYMKN